MPNRTTPAAVGPGVPERTRTRARAAGSLARALPAFVLAALVGPPAVLVPAAAQYTVARTEVDGEVVRAHVVADLAPVVAVVRREATRAATLAAPGLMASRDLGTHRLRDLALEVDDVRFARGAHGAEVRIEVTARVTALRDARRIVWEGVVPSVRLVPEGRHAIARARLVVSVDVAVRAASVAVRVLGERLRLTDPIAADLDLGRRVLHRHVEPIGPHPSLDGLTPEAAAVEGLEASRLRFVVRFRRHPH